MIQSDRGTFWFKVMIIFLKHKTQESIKKNDFENPYSSVLASCKNNFFRALYTKRFMSCRLGKHSIYARQHVDHTYRVVNND